MNWVSLLRYHGPSKIITEKTAIILGTALKVCSWIEVTAWNKLTVKPTNNAVSSNGSDKFIKRAKQ